MDYDSEIDDIDDVNPADDDPQVGFHQPIDDELDFHAGHGHENIHHSSSEVDSMMEKLHQKINHETHETTEPAQIHFGAKYSDAEIDKMKSDVSMAEHEVSCRKSDVELWESKVSLNNTKEHRENGDYANAVSRLNEAKSRYNNVVDRLNSAKAKLNNAT